MSRGEGVEPLPPLRERKKSDFALDAEAVSW